MPQTGRIQPQRERPLCAVSRTERPVVVGVNGSDGSSAAVRWAARHASETGAPVRLVHARSASDTASDKTYRPALLSRADGGADPGRNRRISDRILGTAAAEVVRYHPQIGISARSACDPVVEVLADASADAEVLVVGSSRRSRWATLFTSVAIRIVAAARCPVVVVRGDERGTGPVVAAVDGSPDCEPALRFAFLEAARLGRALVAVHAWQTPLLSAGVRLREGRAAADPVTDDEVVAAEWGSMTAAVGKWRAAFPDLVVHERLIRGEPGTVVCEETAGAALVVVGSRALGPLSGLLLGSTSHHLVNNSGCPVAVVRHRDDVSPDPPPTRAGNGTAIVSTP